MKRALLGCAAILTLSVLGCNSNSSAQFFLPPQKLYLVDQGSANLYVYTLPANGSSTPAVTRATTFVSPYGAAFDTSGHLFVIDDTSPGVVYGFTLPITASSTPFASVTITGSNNAFELAFDPTGNLWVADTGNHRALGFHGPFSGSSTPTAFAIVPTGASEWGVQSDSAGDIFAVAGNHVVRFPAPVTSASTPNAALSNMTEPIPMAFDSNGNLYVADFQTGTLNRYNAPITNGETPSITDLKATSGLVNPYGMALDRNGTLYVADCTTTVKAYTTSTFSSTSTPSFVINVPSPASCTAGLAIQ